MLRSGGVDDRLELSDRGLEGTGVGREDGDGDEVVELEGEEGEEEGGGGGVDEEDEGTGGEVEGGY